MKRKTIRLIKNYDNQYSIQGAEIFNLYIIRRGKQFYITDSIHARPTKSGEYTFFLGGANVFNSIDEILIRLGIAYDIEMVYANKETIIIK